MQPSGFFLHKRLLCLDQLRSCSVQADDELTILALDQYRISDMETGERVCSCIHSVRKPSVPVRSSLPCVCPPFSIVWLETKQAADLGSLPHLQLIYSNSYSIMRLNFR